MKAVYRFSPEFNPGFHHKGAAHAGLVAQGRFLLSRLTVKRFDQNGYQMSRICATGPRPVKTCPVVVTHRSVWLKVL
ncbi:uncharacterized [Tachysurus ichikawai]